MLNASSKYKRDNGSVSGEHRKVRHVRSTSTSPVKAVGPRHRRHRARAKRRMGINNEPRATRNQMSARYGNRYPIALRTPRHEGAVQKIEEGE